MLNYPEFDVGDAVTLHASAYRSNGALIPNSAYTLEITTPDGETETVAGTSLTLNTEERRYEYEYLITQAKWHTYKFIVSGPRGVQKSKFYAIE